MIAPPPEVGAILESLRSGGHEAYPVGGCVRDILLGLTPGDWDITSSATPEEVIRLFGAENTLPTGIRHGTVTVRRGGVSCEVTAFRTEGDYSDHRRPDSVTFVSSLREDLGRRDFTVNAMALGENGEIIDLFGGQEDLQRGLIRCVGDPEARFREDALRILRALRFAARLGFAIEAGTAGAILRCRDLLPALSAERVWAELKGILPAPGADAVLREFAPVFRAVLPELTEADFAGAEISPLPPDFGLRFAFLFRNAPAEALDAALARLRCENGSRKRILALHWGFHAPLPEKREELLPWVQSLGWEDAAAVLRLRGAGAALALLEEAAESRLPTDVGGLALKGGDLLALGMKPGRDVGETLEMLLGLVWAGAAENSPEGLLPPAEKRLRCLIDSCGAVVFREGTAGPEALMILHRKGWGFPKGHLQPGETEGACAGREVAEETGITAVIDTGFRQETPSQREGDRRKVVFFLGRYAAGEARPQEGETRAVRWFPASEAAWEVYYPGDRAIYEAAWEYYKTNR